MSANATHHRVRAYRVELCAGAGACTPVGPAGLTLDLPTRSLVAGRVHDAHCALKGLPLTLLPTGARGRCAVATFTARLDGPAIHTPRVRPLYGSNGTYAIEPVHIADAGEYSLSLRLDHQNDAGMCACRVNESVTYLHQLLARSPTIIRAADAPRAATVSPAPPGGLGTPPLGRWLRHNCSTGAARGRLPPAEARYVDDWCAARGPRAALLRRGEHLYVPSARGVRWRVLPLDFARDRANAAAAAGGERVFWLHMGGDSIIMRGELEELLALFEGLNGAKYNMHNVTCLDVMGGRTLVRRTVCGDHRARGLARTSHGLVNVHEWTFGELGGTLGEDLGGAGRLIVSTHGGTGVTPPPVVAGCRGVDDVLPPPPGHRGREHHCNATHGVGSLFWPELFKLMRSKMRTNAAPDAIVYNYMLHYAISDKLCTSEYADYWRFAMRSVRAAYAGDVLWHTGLRTHFDAPGHGAVYREQADGWPDGAHGIRSYWMCRSSSRIDRLRDEAGRVASEYGAHELAADDICAAWPMGTVDNRHFEGGFFNRRKQVVSITVLNALLNLLGDLASNDTRRHPDRRQSRVSAAVQ